MTMLVPSRNPDLICRSLENELVIIRPQDGEIRVLNSVGEFIWNVLDGQRCVDDLVKLIGKEYEVEEFQARNDLIEFLEGLVVDGFIRMENTGDAKSVPS